VSLNLWQERLYGDGSLNAMLDDLWRAVGELGKIESPSPVDVTACAFVRRTLREAAERLADMERQVAHHQDSMLDLVLDDLG